MNVLTFDVETTHIQKEAGGTTALPYFGNRLVSIGYKWLGCTVHYQCYYHADRQATDDAAKIFQRELDMADIIVGHNIKFDLSWVAVPQGRQDLLRHTVGDSRRVRKS